MAHAIQHMSNASLDNAKHHYHLDDIEIDDDKWNTRILELEYDYIMCKRLKLDFDKLCPPWINADGKMSYTQLQKQRMSDAFEEYIDEKHPVRFAFICRFGKDVVDNDNAWEFTFKDLNDIYDMLRSLVFTKWRKELDKILYVEQSKIDSNAYHMNDICVLTQHSPYELHLSNTMFRQLTFKQVVEHISKYMFMWHLPYDHDRKIIDLALTLI